MPPKEQSTQPENLLVEIVGTVLGLAVIGGVAWGILYLRKGASGPHPALILVVLGCLAVAILGPKVLRAFKSR